MQFMLIRLDNGADTAAAGPRAVLDDLLARLPGAGAAADPGAGPGAGSVAAALGRTGPRVGAVPAAHAGTDASVGAAVANAGTDAGGDAAAATGAGAAPVAAAMNTGTGTPRPPALAVAFAPDSTALRLALRPGGATVAAGPFPADERLPAGFAVFEAPSRATALAWLRERGPVTGGAGVTLELRETGCPGGCPGIPPGTAGDDACYAILLRSDAGTERDAVPPQDKLDRLNAFNAIHAAAGTLLAGDGLKSTARGARVRAAAGRTSIIDGPFAEAKELIAGFWMIRAPSTDAALEWARTLPYPTGPSVQVEIRRVALIASHPAAAAPASAPATDRTVPARGAAVDGAAAAGNVAAVDDVAAPDDGATATAARLREDASVRAEQLDAALRAELAPQPTWNRA